MKKTIVIFLCMILTWLNTSYVAANAPAGGTDENAWAKAYFGVVNNLIEQYGEGAIKTFDYGSVNDGMSGVPVVRLIDFDGNGTFELYCAFADNGLWVNRHVLYGYSDGLVMLMKETEISNPGTDVSPSTTFLTKNGTTYLVDVNEITHGNYYTLLDGKLVSALSYEGRFFTEEPVLNGTTVTNKTLDKAIDEMEAGGTVERIEYYYNPDSNVFLKTRNTIMQLEAYASGEGKNIAAAESLQSTNIADLYIHMEDRDKTILFCNGSISLFDVEIENGRAMVPISWFAVQFGVSVETDEADGTLKISEPGNEIAMKTGSKTATVNGKEYQLDIAPSCNVTVYVPLRFVAEALGATVDYYNGSSKALDYEGWLAETAARYIPNINQIMISRYPIDLKPLTAEEALAIVCRQINEANTHTPESYQINTAKLKVVSENDRYYLIPVVWDFWVDKYTGDVYVFYNGSDMWAYKFNPYLKGALGFAG